MLDERCTTVVVVPTYEERETLPLLVEQFVQLGRDDLGLLVVDDNSPDGTGAVADALAAEHPGWIDVLHRPGKQGLGRSYVAGISRALAGGAEIVIQMDADLSHPVGTVPDMIELVRRTDVDVVIGSRYVPGGAIAADWPLSRRLLSRWANRYVDAVLRLGVADATAGFKAWRASALLELDLAAVRSNGYAFQVEMNHRAVRLGMRVAEVPITFIERVGGASKMSLAVQWESALVPWKLRRTAGSRVHGREARRPVDAGRP